MNREDAGPNEPVRDLNSEDFSTNPEAMARELLRLLNKEVCFARLAAIPSDPINPLPIPFI